MSPTQPTDHGNDGRLPPLRAVLVVDAENFSQVPGAQQADLNTTIQEVLEAAFVRAGLADAWAGRRFSTHTGDGYVVGLPVEWLALLVHPFLSDLQAVLRERHDSRLRSEPPLRLRASLHCGLLQDEGRPNDGVGKPRVDAHRLVDSDVLRKALRASDENVTFLAALLSRRVFEDVVEPGYTKLRASQFERVEVVVKSFEEIAYLHVPQPSGRDAADTAPPPSRPAAPSPAPARPARAAGVIFEGRTDVRGDVVGGDQWKITESDR